MGMVAIIHSLQQGEVDLRIFTLHGGAMGPLDEWLRLKSRAKGRNLLSPLHFATRPRMNMHNLWPNMLRFKMIQGPRWSLRSSKNLTRQKLHGFVIQKKTDETGKAKPWKRARGSTKTTCSLYAPKQSIIIDTQIWYIPINTYYIYPLHYHTSYVDSVDTSIPKPFPAESLPGRFGPWTSGRQNYGAMLPALWKNWTWPSSSWESSGHRHGGRVWRTWGD